MKWKEPLLPSFLLGRVWFIIIVQWEELFKSIVEKELNNFGGTGMKEKDKRDSDFLKGGSRLVEEFCFFLWLVLNRVWHIGA